MDTPLFDKIKNINTYPLHMPGHKRRFFDFDLTQLDVTEIPGTDNLHKPEGVILQAQKRMAELTGADYTLFCVNGGSSGILTAILGCCGPDDRLLTVKNAHKSIYNGMILSGCTSAFISPEITPFGVCGGVSCEKIEKALKLYDDIKAVLIVSPTYEGFVSDVSSIARVVHSYNKILIVDETHGSHFPFHKAFPKSAIECGADISVNSWHKTLPALGQSAVINIKGHRVDMDKIKTAHSMVNTTSPSYMLMGAMDYIRGYLCEHIEIWEEYIQNLTGLQNKLDKFDTFFNGCRLKGKYGIFDYDISKLTLFLNNDINNIESIMLEKGLQLELADDRHIIAMTSVADDFRSLNEFADLISELDKREYINICREFKADDNIVVSNLRPYFYMDKIEIELDRAEGRISADFVTPFPPDIPILIPGQIITKEIINTIRSYKQCVLGLSNNKIKVVGDNNGY